MRTTKGACFAVGLLAVLTAAASRAETTTEELKITVGKSIVLDYPADVRQISTSDPAIVDAVAVTTREILLHGKSHGAATVVIWAKNGHRTFYSITVEHNLEPIRRLLKETFPNEDIRVQSARDSVTLTGTVSSKEVADRATAVVTPLAKSVVNNLQLPQAPVERQIILRVKFAELNRAAGKAFGVNILSTGAGNNLGRATTGQFNSATFGNLQTGGGAADATISLSDALNVFMFRPDLNLGAFVRSLQNQDLLQILAEPNIVTTNGKEASFLVGGEFPVPVIQGGSNSGAVTVQFREFGIRLTFLPNLTPNGTIKMYVKPEVSTVDLANSVTVAGFTIPALATRRIESHVELGPGQSFAIGGLVDDRVTESIQKIPGLASVPVLGALFKSRMEKKQKTELLVLVTPEIAEPLRPGDPKPELPMLRPPMDTKRFDKTPQDAKAKQTAAGPKPAPAKKSK
jgi:pilus assembly protein CpaC